MFLECIHSGSLTSGIYSVEILAQYIDMSDKILINAFTCNSQSELSKDISVDNYLIYIDNGIKSKKIVQLFINKESLMFWH